MEGVSESLCPYLYTYMYSFHEEIYVTLFIHIPVCLPSMVHSMHIDNACVFVPLWYIVKVHVRSKP